MKHIQKFKKIFLFHIILACLVVFSAMAWHFSNAKLSDVKTSTAISETHMEKAAEPMAEVQNTAKNISVKNSATSGKNFTENPAQSTALEPEELTPEENTKTLTLSMVGDILLHTPVSKSGLQKDGTYNYDHLFKYIRKKVKSYDVSMLNEEVVLAGASFGITGYPQFNGRFEVGDAIEKAGFDVILHATNHSMDKGKAGLLSDLNQWKNAHPKLKIVGMYRTKKESEKITYVKKNGIRIAILNYTYGTNGLPLPSDMPFAVNLMNEARVKSDIKKARKKADFIIVCPHWGTEYQDGIDSYQKKWTDFFLKQKVDLVIGTHPHVIEPVKWVSDDKTGHKMLVYYSLGNYVNSTARRGAGTFRQYLGGMADVTIEKTEDGTTSIKDAGFLPLITHYAQDGKITTFFFSDYTEAKAKKNRLSNQDRTFTFQGAKKHFKKIISKKFLI